MRTDIAIDKLCDIAPYIADIMDKVNDDKELKDTVLKFAKTNKKSDYIRFLPLLVKKCNTEIYGVLAVLYNKTEEEVREQDLFSETIPQIKELLSNKDFRDFFTSLTGSGETEKEADELSTTSTSTDEETADTTYAPFASTSNIE